MNPSRLDPYLGKPVEVEDPSAFAQCMDLAFLWCDLNGINRASIRNSYAYQVWNNHDANVWTQSQTPSPGALVVYSQAVGSAGHIAVMKNATQSYNQNWNHHSYVTLETLPSNGRLGYLIHKGATPQGGDMTDLDTERRLAYWIYGFNGVYQTKNSLNGDIDEQLKKSVGRDTNDAIRNMTDDEYGQAYKKYLTTNQTYQPVSETLYRKT